MTPPSAETDQQQREQPRTAAVTEASAQGQLLFDFWYIASESSEVRGRELHKVTLLGLPLVVGRDEKGKAFAMRDTCPHRGIPLSCGRVFGEQLECCYHGWRFDVHSGQCREIPSLVPEQTLDPAKIYAIAYPCEERDGYIWVYVTQGRTRNLQPPPVPELPVHSASYKRAHLRAVLPLNIDHGVIGLMDPAHGPFVHQSWWWRSRRSIHRKQKTFEPIPMGFRIQSHTPSANSGAYKLLRFYSGGGDAITTTIDFTLPNIRVEQIRIGNKWVTNRAVVTPIDQNRCRLDFSAAWNIFPWLPMKTLFRLFGNEFIEQDRRTMEMQSEGLKSNPSLMLIDDADRLARWYFQLKAAYLESRRTGEAMVHPMSGPVTLRWRS